MRKVKQNHTRNCELEPIKWRRRLQLQKNTIEHNQLYETRSSIYCLHPTWCKLSSGTQCIHYGLSDKRDMQQIGYGSDYMLLGLSKGSNQQPPKQVKKKSTSAIKYLNPVYVFLSKLNKITEIIYCYLQLHGISQAKFLHLKIFSFFSFQ